MKKLLCSFISIILFFTATYCFAQNLVDVSPLTGTANVHIPIYTVTSGSLSVPVSLNYNTNGVKIKDVEGTAGMGWNLQAGGQVTREVRGLPDDYEQSNGGTQYLGWMVISNPGPTRAESFVPQNIGDGTCSKETADVNTINNNFYYYQDTEPDIFDVNAPGLSCQLIFDRSSNQFRPQVYQDLKITYSAASDNSVLSSFTITNDKGVTYHFSNDEEVIQTTFNGTPTYFSSLYNQYKNGVTYFDKWSLSQMTDATGNTITFGYTTAPVRHGVDSVSLYLPPNITVPQLQYYMQTAVYSGILQSISTGNVNSSTMQRLALNWTTFNLPFSNETGQTCIASITGFGRTFQFTYSPVASSTGYTRNFLRNYSDGGPASPIGYTFAYSGETKPDGEDYLTTLPDSNSFKVDYWGYPVISSPSTSLMPNVIINPTNSAFSRYAIFEAAAATGSYAYQTYNGQDRSAATTNFDLGCLTSITTAKGGTSTILYEPNTYIDVPSGQQITGGGIRVITIKDYDGMDATKNIVRNYTYTIPGSTVSSGRPITLPNFAFTIPYSGSATGQALWDAVTAMSQTDLSSDDHRIIYSYCTVSQTNAGSTQYHFAIPATNWDTNVVPIGTGCTTVEWNPTMNLSSRTSCSLSYGPVKNDIYSYPFLPSTNFDFERGLPISIITLNQNSQKVSEADYTYQQYPGPYQITPIAGFHADDNINSGLTVKGYNIYLTYYNARELTATITNQVYDSPTLSVSRPSSVTYTYGSTVHELPTMTSVTNSDQSTVTTHITYTKDYPVTAPSSNVNINALYYLQQENVNVPVETYQQVTPLGGTPLTVGASLNLFKGYTWSSVTNYLLAQQYNMISNAGEVFSPFSINTAASSISKDPNYYLTTNIDRYDDTGSPITIDDGNKHIQSSLRDLNSGMLTASVSNAKNNEFAFNDFDSKFSLPNYSFSISGTGFTANGSHTGNAYGLNTSQTVTSTILSRNSIASNYIFSIWINAATAGSLSISLTGISSTSTLTYAGGWKYYEIKIPAGTLASSYTVSFTTSTAISIDDILFYPDVAEVNTFAYDPSTHYSTASTNTNGVSSYYAYDPWGRPTYTYDRDKNIVERRTYANQAMIALGVGPYFFYSPQPAGINVPITFEIHSSQSQGVTYSMDFGDGSPKVYGVDVTSFTHTYTTANTYTATIFGTTALLGTSSNYESIPVLSQAPALFPHICQYGVTKWSNCTHAAVTTTYCGDRVGTNVNSYFYVTSVDNSEYYPIHYHWQQSFDGGSTWTNVGTDADTWTSPTYDSSRQYPYFMRCLVTSSHGQPSGTSGQLNVQVLCE